MKKSQIEHATHVVERSFKASVARLWAALSKAEELKQWDYPGNETDGFVMGEHEVDFRVGGRDLKSFGPKGGPFYRSDGRFLDIASEKRIVTAATTFDAEGAFSSTLCTIEIGAEGTGSWLVLTDQTAFFRMEKPSDRRQGVKEVVDRLESLLG